MAEHKHAAVLRAIADGKAVQYFSRASGEWIAAVENNPISEAGYDWRIKPEPKPDVVRYMNVYDDQSVGDMYLSSSDSSLRCISDKGVILCLRWDSETGKLKSAEVLP